MKIHPLHAYRARRSRPQGIEQFDGRMINVGEIVGNIACAKMLNKEFRSDAKCCCMGAYKY